MVGVKRKALVVSEWLLSADDFVGGQKESKSNITLSCLDENDQHGLEIVVVMAGALDVINHLLDLRLLFVESAKRLETFYLPPNSPGFFLFLFSC